MKPKYRWLWGYKLWHAANKEAYESTLMMDDGYSYQTSPFYSSPYLDYYRIR